jgi:site-specific recombinase XerD
LTGYRQLTSCLEVEEKTMENPSIEKFREYLLGQDKSALTVKGYLSDLVCFERWFEQTHGEAFTLQAVTPTDMQEYCQFMLVVECHKANTINRQQAALSGLMKWAKESGQIEHDPTGNVHAIPKTNPGPRYLDKKEQSALQRAIEEDLRISRLRYPKRWVTRRRDASLLVFLLHTGLHLSEALALQLDDVQLADGKGQVLVRQGKVRTVPLNVQARRAMQEWLTVRPGNGSHVWVQVEGEPSDGLSNRSVERVLVRIGQDAGLEHLTPHILRHTFAKNLVDRGVGLEKVAALLGHSNLNTTQIYATTNQKDLEQAVDQMGQDEL